jgi:hypothetical protein
MLDESEHRRCLGRGDSTRVSARGDEYEQQRSNDGAES